VAEHVRAVLLRDFVCPPAVKGRSLDEEDGQAGAEEPFAIDKLDLWQALGDQAPGALGWRACPATS
jgi:hypothetical protein